MIATIVVASDRCDHMENHMETTLAIVATAIVAIIWKPGLVNGKNPNFAVCRFYVKVSSFALIVNV